jgi:hypothetical protein
MLQAPLIHQSNASNKIRLQESGVVCLAYLAYSPSFQFDLGPSITIARANFNPPVG